MDRILPASVHVAVAVALSCATTACQDAHAEELSSRVRALYAGSLTTTVEQPEAEAECGREYVTSESSGYLSLDRAQPSVRLEGFGCELAVAEARGAEFKASAQDCLPVGVVNFKGLGLDRLVIESFSVNLGDKKTSWQARAWRELPTSRVSYCFSLTAQVEQRCGETGSCQTLLGMPRQWTRSTRRGDGTLAAARLITVVV